MIQSIYGEDWLKREQVGYKDLADDEISAILGFYFIWGVFEHHALGDNCNNKSIGRFVDVIRDKTIEISTINTSIKHYQLRFADNSLMNSRFDSLNFRDSSQKNHVRDVLTGHNSSIDAKIKALIFIVYRLRNNLFHGVKWGYEMRDQKDNFEVAVNFLTDIMSQTNVTRNN